MGIKITDGLKKRFWDKVERIPFHECWEWIAGRDLDGYGVLWGDRNHSLLKPHQISLMLVGVEVPDGMHVDHKCRNRGCVNPNHLRVVTPSVNALENSHSICVAQKAKTHCNLGHSLTGNNLLQVKAAVRACKRCARERARQRNWAKQGKIYSDEAFAKPKTHCKHGHEFNSEHRDWKGALTCRVCRKRRDLDRYHANKAAVRKAGCD